MKITIFMLGLLGLMTNAHAKLAVLCLSDQVEDDSFEIEFLLKNLKKNTLISQVLSKLENSSEEYVILTFSEDLRYKVSPGRNIHDGTFSPHYDTAYNFKYNYIDDFSASKDKIRELSTLAGKNVVSIYQSNNPKASRKRLIYNVISEEVLAQELYHAAQHEYYWDHHPNYFAKINEHMNPTATFLKLAEVEGELATLLSVPPSSPLEVGVSKIKGIDQLLLVFKDKIPVCKSKISELDTLAEEIWIFMEENFGYSVEKLEQMSGEFAKTLELKDFEFLFSLFVPLKISDC